MVGVQIVQQWIVQISADKFWKKKRSLILLRVYHEVPFASALVFIRCRGLSTLQIRNCDPAQKRIPKFHAASIKISL